MNAILVALMVFVASLRVAYAADGEEAPSKPGYRIVVDRVEHEPVSITGTRLSIYVSALTVQGQRLDLAEPGTIRTLVGASELKAPFALGTYAGTGSPTAIVLVVQSTIDYAEVLPIVIEQIDTTLLANLDERTLFTVLPYGETVGSGKLQPIKIARTKLGLLGAPSQDSAGDPALIETVERALMLLKKQKAEPEGASLRKLIILVGDGRDRSGDKDRVTRLGLRAAKEGVRIHSFAYSPTDQRRPLLLLGELSRKSLGTFRWLQIGKADSWAAKFAQLLEEIQKQYVLTYFVAPDDDPGGKKLKVTTVGRTEAASNEAKVPTALCHEEECSGYCVQQQCIKPREAEGRGIFGWVLLVGGIGVGALVLLGLVGWVMSKRSPSIPLPPGVDPATIVGKVKKAPTVLPGQLTMPQQPVVAPPPPQQQQVAALMFVSGPRANERVAIWNGFLVGKGPACQLIIDDGYTSTHHAQFGVDANGGWHIYDHNSTNGTFVDGQRVTNQLLANGATIRIGGTDLRFQSQ